MEIKPTFTDRLIVKALARYWERTGMRKVCLTCINSRNKDGYGIGFDFKGIHFWGGGCCHGCSVLGPQGCTDKPVSCAVWMCGPLQSAFPIQTVFLQKIVRKLLGRFISDSFSPSSLRKHVEIPRGNKLQVLIQIRSAT